MTEEKAEIKRKSNCDDVVQIVQICCVSRRRAEELLEAASGNLDRAIHIHLSEPTTTTAANTTTTSTSHSDGPAEKIKSPPKGKRAAVIPIDAYFSPQKKFQSPRTSIQTSSKLPSITTVTTLSERKLPEGFPQKSESVSTQKELRNEGLNVGLQNKVETDVTIIDSYVDQNLDDAPDNRLVSTTTSTANTKSCQYSELEYAVLASFLSKVSRTTLRTVKIRALLDLFGRILQHVGGIHDAHNRSMDCQTLIFAIDLILGKLSLVTIGVATIDINHTNTTLVASASSSTPPLQISGSAISKAIQTVTGISRSRMSESYRQLGDLGDVAAEYWASAQKHSAARFFQPEKIKSKSTLSLRKVHETLQSIALVPPGKGSQETRQQKMVKLLRSCRGADEMRFVVRALLGNMRLGATLKTILVALEAAVKKCENISEIEPSPTTETTPFLEEIYNICPRIPDLAFALLRGGMSMAAKTCSLTVGCPIQPMLANPCSEFIDVREFVRDEQQDLPAVLEWKYDGVRCQAHWDGKITRLFSRHLLDNTEQYPDVVQFIGEAKHDTVQSFVMDAEIVGIACDGEDGIRLLPFQDLSTRRGSGRQNIDDNDVQVAIFAFDLMFLNGESLLKETLWKRQQLLRESFRESSGFRFASSVPLPRYDESIVQGALEDAIRGGAEGLMIKLTGEDPAVTSHPNVSTTTFAKSSRTFGYESGKRGKLWLKLKRDYVNGYADTIDVVPIGAWHGSGRKAVNAFLSPVLFAVYDDDEGTFQSVSRCMSFSDDMYQAMREFYFRGTPYPSGVGSCVVSEETLEQQANEDHHSDSDVDNEPVRTQEDSGITDDPDVSSDRVNCYPCKPPNVTTNEKPTFWFKPLEVLEVSFADLSLSRAHTAGAECIHDDDHRGIALRFPRFKRRRPDKSVYQATSASQLADLYRQQSKIHSK